MQINANHVTLGALAVAAAVTAALVWMGVTGQQWPEWLLVVATVL